MELDMRDDLRWSDPESGERLTYIETLAAELKHHNRWINKGEWAAIEKMLPGITEESAKEQCFILRDKRRGRIEHWHRLYD